MKHIDTFQDYLQESGQNRFGLCMFAPATKARKANSLLSAAYNDSGDNLSVPMQRQDGKGKVEYLAANYSSASFETTMKTIDAFKSVPGSVILITEPGVGAQSAVTIGLFEGGSAKPFLGTSHSFFSFSREHLGVEIIENSSDGI